MTIDDDGVQTEIAGSSDEFYSDAESELGNLQERAARSAAAARTLAETAQNEQVRDEMQRTLAVMNGFANAAGQLSDVAATAGEQALQGVNKGLMELYRITRNRSLSEWGVGAATAILSLFPQLVTPGVETAMQSVFLGGMSGAALTLGAVAVADYLYRLGGFVSVIRRNPQTQAAITLAEQSIQSFRDAARRMLTDAQVPDDEKRQLQRALVELERREALRMRADRGEQQAIQLLEQIRERKRPLEQYPDPGDPLIEEVIEQPARRQRMLEGSTGSQPALEAGLRFEMIDNPPSEPILISEQRRAELMARMAANERVPDPSRERETGNNTDYRMQNGLILRFHQSPTVMFVQLLSPAPSASEGSAELGTVARLRNWREKSGDEIERVRLTYERAKKLEPTTAEALAAINKTAEMDMPLPAGRAAGSTGTRTPASQAPATPGAGSAPGSRGRLRRMT
jgi:hypothetical protein